MVNDYVMRPQEPYTPPKKSHKLLIGIVAGIVALGVGIGIGSVVTHSSDQNSTDYNAGWNAAVSAAQSTDSVGHVYTSVQAQELCSNAQGHDSAWYQGCQDALTSGAISDK